MTEPQQSIFSLRLALQEGKSRSQLRSRAYQRPFPGVIANKQNYSQGQFLAAICANNPGTVITSITAAKFLGFRLPARYKDDCTIHLMTGKRHKRIQVKGASSTQAEFSTAEILEIQQALLTNHLRTFLELGKIFTPLELLHVAEGLLCYHQHRADQKIPLVTKEELFTYLKDKKGIRGVARCKWAVEQARIGSDSWQETSLRLCLEEYGLNNLVVNPPIYNAEGYLLFEPDLADFEAKLSIQYEGEHHLSRQQALKDRARLRRTTEAGWQEVRIFAEDLRERVQYRGLSVPRAVYLVRKVLDS